MTLLSATVPEVKALLDEAGIAAEYPKNMEDVVQMAKTTQSLGPKHVIIKREIFDEGSKTTTLHFVLAGEGEEPVIKSARFENPKGVAGTSYSIPRQYFFPPLTLETTISIYHTGIFARAKRLQKANVHCSNHISEPGKGEGCSTGYI